MTIERGSLVLLEYISKLADGTVVEGTHRDGDPSPDVTTGIRLVSVGDPSYPVIKGLDQALINAEVNTPQTMTVQPADAYGERRRDKIKMLPIRKLESDNTRVGDEVTVGGEKGVVLSMGSGRVRIDFNHKHAGKSLTFDFTVLKHLESDTDKILALLTNAEILPGTDLASMYESMEGAGDDELEDDLDDDLDDDLEADLDDELEGLDDDLDDDLEADLEGDLDDKDDDLDDLEADLEADLGTGDESKDSELETALDDDDLDAELDKALDRDLGLDDGENLDAEPAKGLDDGLETALEADLGGDKEENLEADLGTEDESKDDDLDLEAALGLDDDDLDLDDKDLEAEDLDSDKDLDDDLDDMDDDKDLDDLFDDLDDNDLDDDDLDDDLDDLDDDLEDLDDDLTDNAGVLDPYANIPGYVLANDILTVAVPSSMYRSPDLQTKKFSLQMDIFKFVPDLKVVRFVETHQNVAA